MLPTGPIQKAVSPTKDKQELSLQFGNVHSIVPVTTRFYSKIYFLTVINPFTPKSAVFRWLRNQKKQKTFFSHTAGSLGIGVRGVSGHASS